MRLRIRVASDEDVLFAGASSGDRQIYYGEPPRTGLWKLNLPEIEDYISDHLHDKSFGHSIDEFGLGLDIADLEGSEFFKNRAPVSYSPNRRTIFSNGRIDWPVIKDLSADEQFRHFVEAFMEAIVQLSVAKRKPKGFDELAFASAVRRLLDDCGVDRFVHPAAR